MQNFIVLAYLEVHKLANRDRQTDRPAPGGILKFIRKLSTGITFHCDGSFQGVKFSGVILHWGNLLEFLYEILLISFFLFADSILHVGKFFQLKVRSSIKT